MAAKTAAGVGFEPASALRRSRFSRRDGCLFRQRQRDAGPNGIELHPVLGFSTRQLPVTAVYLWDVVRRLLFSAFVKVHVAVYRASGGRLGGRLRKDLPVLLLTTTGRKTGRRRTTPLLYVEEADRYVVVASAGGAPSHPAWYLNLRNNPAATIQVGGRKLAVTAETAGLEERARLWPRLTQMWPQYDDYQAKTRREIPVVILAPSAA
jgi:F420H(2)-dependent quinone reductase